MTIRARQVDPRDVDVEVDARTFRVYFWRSAPGRASREFEVTGGEVYDVIGWADRNMGPDETYELGVLELGPECSGHLGLTPDESRSSK